MEYKITDNVYPLASDVKLGDQITLKNQTQEVVKCQETGVPMLNIDADQLAPGDLRFIKKLGLTISNPETSEPVALGVEIAKKKSFGDYVDEYLTSDSSDDDDDDSSFFSSGGLFGGSSSSGGFGGGFGGFGGGGFSGGGASGGF